MKKYTLLSLAIFFCWIAITYADGIYDDGCWWTISKNNKIVNKSGYPPDEKLLEEKKQKCVYTAEDIPFDKAKYKDGKVIRHIKTTEETETELKERARMAEYKIITRKMMEIAIEQLEAEGYKFKYNHLEPYVLEYIDFRPE